MPINRVAWRNVHLYDASTGINLGGFYQAGSLTEANLIWMLKNVLVVMSTPVIGNGWTIKHRQSGRTITSSSDLVATGDYDFYSEGMSFIL